ncbi:MAG: hypothetical protein J6Y02_16445 [Pseudobutyrivibrio sp.]|nr:hypothetical protein [Pseudobutyrivibrio sp.]
MYLGTTPHIEFTFDEVFDLTNLVEVWITFANPKLETKQYKKTYKISDDNVTVVPELSKIELNLTQEQTLELEGLSNVECQLRFLFSDETAPVTNIVTIPVERILEGGVITSE